MARLQESSRPEQQRQLVRYVQRAFLPSRHTAEAIHSLGFYTLDPLSPPSKPQLILGPFHGKVACQTIAFGFGVCGVAAESGQTQLVPDVTKFPNHIACDSESRSEMVVPVLVPAGAPGDEGVRATKVVAVIDIDCTEVNGL